MATLSGSFHEAEERLRPGTRDRRRAIVSLMEELEAIDWYQQRIDATGDAGRREILEHNRDEMLLGWLRRNDATFDARLREYLFGEGSIVAREAAVEREAASGNGHGGRAPATPTVTVGPLRRTA